MKLAELMTLVVTHSLLANATDVQEPFVGWTQEDLDAKWGTDVSRLCTFVRRDVSLTAYSGASRAFRRSPI